MAKCSKCGAELTAGKKFCGNCGAEVFVQNNEIGVKPRKNDIVASAVYGVLAIIGIIMIIIGLFSYDTIKVFYWEPIFRLIDIGIGLILLVLGAILFAKKRK